MKVTILIGVLLSLFSVVLCGGDEKYDVALLENALRVKDDVIKAVVDLDRLAKSAKQIVENKVHLNLTNKNVSELLEKILSPIVNISIRVFVKVYKLLQGLSIDKILDVIKGL